MMEFANETEFEKAFVEELTHHGWSDKVLYKPTEQDLIDNWANILYQNNKHRDSLNGVPLCKEEMDDLIDRINTIKEPFKLNTEIINQRSLTIVRKNPEDTNHFGKLVELKIFDRAEIGGGDSVYQIVRQPVFGAKIPKDLENRGDVMLLINGMPVIHVELKKSDFDLQKAINQIQGYQERRCFTGIFGLIQVFAGMTPGRMKYFANPGSPRKYKDFLQFEWADFQNRKMTNWKDITVSFFSIPMAHQLIGYYTVADRGDDGGNLKVMRSYQYYAVSRIAKIVSENQELIPGRRVGYINAATGSGKTLTSYKCAQLISSLGYADKVVFLADRIELTSQTHERFENFEAVDGNIADTKYTQTLVSKLLSSAPKDQLIVSSLHKMARIKEDNERLKIGNLDKINNKRIVIIIDEVQRSTFGTLLGNIRDTFPCALVFGFTGTPIKKDNQKKGTTTSDLFGDELHRYSIADAIKDHNVLPYDINKESAFPAEELRKAVALDEAKAVNVKEAMADPAKKKVFQYWMNKKNKTDLDVEKKLPTSQYDSDEYRNKVAADIAGHFETLSNDHTYNAILACSSIREALEYWRIFRKQYPEIKAACVFDPSDNHNDFSNEKKSGIIDCLVDYEKMFGVSYDVSSYGDYKADVASRMGHTDPYDHLAEKGYMDQRLDLMIVVDQMLTGFDSKWINTLYLDKVLEYERVIQAFARTNRLEGPDKQQGTIFYYRYPEQMEVNINNALTLYAGQDCYDIYVDKLPENVMKINELFGHITEVFEEAEIENFEELPEDEASIKQFVLLFQKMNARLASAKLQGFRWEIPEYKTKPGSKKPDGTPADIIYVSCDLDENTYNTLLRRYSELMMGTGVGEPRIPYDIAPSVSHRGGIYVDEDYLNSKFVKYIKAIESNVSTEEQQQALEVLHKSFASLSKASQIAASQILSDIEFGVLKVDPNVTFFEYLQHYLWLAENEKNMKMVEAFGIDMDMLKKLLDSHVTEKNIDEFGRFEKLKDTVDWNKAAAFMEKAYQKPVSMPLVKVRTTNALREYLFCSGMKMPKVFRMIEESN